MAYPERSGVIRRRARKINARVVFIRSRLAGDRHVFDLRLRTGSSADNVLHHVKHHVRGRALKHLPALLKILGPQYHLAV